VDTGTLHATDYGGEVMEVVIVVLTSATQVVEHFAILTLALGSLLRIVSIEILSYRKHKK
jgi:hypothetical protein